MSVSQEQIAHKLSKMKKLLSHKGYKSTAQRDKIAEWIFSNEEHFTVDELIRSFQNKNKKVSSATAYRVINLLLELDMIIEHDFAKGEKYYESIRDNKDHEHLICQYCNQIIEFENSHMSKYIKQLEKEYHYKIKSYSFKVYGICSNCQNKK